MSGSSSVHRENRKFKKGGSKSHSLEGNGRKCVFCDGDHWSNKCRIVSDVQARKDLLKKGNRCFMCLKTDHISRNCQKTKPCFYCKKLHNSAVCCDKTSSKNSEVSTNYASNISSVLLQTADLFIENPLNKNQVKVKCLFDQGAQMSFLTERIKQALNLKTISKEKTSINAFSSKKFETTELEKVGINLKINSSENFSMCGSFRRAAPFVEHFII